MTRREFCEELKNYKDTASCKHIDQIDGYAAALRSMGYPRVRTFLWYPFLTRIIER